jgi:hypothetical protein
MKIQMLLTGALVCALAGLPAFAANQQAFAQALAKAKAAQAMAASVGGEWRDVGALLKRANEAAAQGEFERALALIAQAQTQSELGYQQAIEQRNPDTVSLFSR